MIVLFSIANILFFWNITLYGKYLTYSYIIMYAYVGTYTDACMHISNYGYIDQH